MTPANARLTQMSRAGFSGLLVICVPFAPTMSFDVSRGNSRIGRCGGVQVQVLVDIQHRADSRESFYCGGSQ